MSKNNTKLTDFFKPFAEPCAKRPLPIEIAQDANAFPSPSRDASSKFEAEPSTSGCNKHAAAAAGSGVQSQGSNMHRLVDSVSFSSDPPVEGGLKSSQNASIGNPGPTSSQLSSSTTSQRILKHGLVVVTNSDEEDSDSSLEDIDSLLTHQEAAILPSSVVSASASTHKRQPQRNGTIHRGSWNSISRQKNHFTTVPVKSSYKFSLDSLVSRTEQDTASEAEVFRARAMMWDPKLTEQQDDQDTMRDDSSQVAAKDPNKVNKGLLASVVDDQSQGVGLQNVLHAMKRTEVGNREKAWHFLEPAQNSEATQSLPFPSKSLLSKNWQGVFNDSASRQQMFLSGAVAEFLAFEVLPDEVIQWVLDELCAEPRDDLRSSYVLALQPTTSQVANILTPARIDELFTKIGARSEATDLERVAVSVEQEKDGLSNVDEPPWANIESVVGLFASVAELLSLPSKEHVICILARMLLDSSLTDNGTLLFAIEDAIEALIDSIPSQQIESSLQRVSTIIIGFVIESQLRLQLLRHLPALTPSLHLFRRRLALAMLFSDLSYLTKPKDALIQLTRVTGQLCTPAFDINDDTDYAELAAMAGILDIAIDDGVSLSGSTDKADINAFNREVDALAATIKAMFGSILDSGASHMTRTEAKEALERVHYRLVHGVRTTAIPRRSLFSYGGKDLGGENGGEQQTLGNFLAK